MFPNHQWMSLLLVVAPMSGLLAAPQADLTEETPAELVQLAVATFARVVQLFEELDHPADASERFTRETWVLTANIFIPDPRSEKEPYRTRWFREGLARYYAWMAQTADGARAEEARDMMAAHIGTYLRTDKAGRVSPREAGMGGSGCRAFLADGGFLTVYCLDLQLRREGSCLDDLVRELALNHGNAYDNTDLAILAEDLTGADFRPFFDSYVTGRDFLPLAEVLDRWELNWDLEETEPMR
ncbi:MAG: hypothetical protein QNK37_02035 [Acidobacteriota bacterium]|nr:hypothetical protein [Acidobacteriota bacterium]